MNKITTVPGCLTALFVACCLAIASGCSGPQAKSAHRGEADMTAYQPKAIGPRLWQETKLRPVSATVPIVPDAEMINDDGLCATCHKTYADYHQMDIHRAQSCETCHGPGSEHLRTRGQQPGLILNPRKLPPIQAAELCLKCHENNACSPGTSWRRSKHAHAGVTCVNCHTGHYNVPPGTPPTSLSGAPLSAPGAASLAKASGFKAPTQTINTGTVPTNIEPASAVSMPDVGQSHQDGHVQLTNMQVDQAADGMDMSAIRAASRAMGARNVNLCINCHREKSDLMKVGGHAHQICGAIGMSCTTCHDPHGNIREQTRTDLCLKCHKRSPVTAWHSSIHSRNLVACVDCHNPHPNSNVPQLANIQHTSVRRQSRLPMGVNQPNACYKCHTKVYAEFALPSHHPVWEGKLVCSDCHDAHGQATGNLREVTINLVCWRCHADKQGPFVWEHPPVTQDCSICHNPHGAVNNNLLRQPATFLCLRCHAGHRGQRRNIDTNPAMRPAFYTDCSQCHSQVHGSDLPAMTRNPRLTR